jgi:hypothetical protein
MKDFALISLLGASNHMHRSGGFGLDQFVPSIAQHIAKDTPVILLILVLPALRRP